jgi:NAD(P) transhydrogenase subunit beta
VNEAFVNLIYLAASVCFIIGLKGLTHPRTAVRGNLLGAAGMLVAVTMALLGRSTVGIGVVFAGIAVGTIVGAVLALKIQMTAMPQLVALFNGFGGGASVLVAGVSLYEPSVGGSLGATELVTATVISGIIGAVTFWGSLVAYGKLQEVISGNIVRYQGQQTINAALLLATVAVGALLIRYPGLPGTYWVVISLASILGILVVLPVGGADMPVVIALLNSFSGLAGAGIGFVLNNNILIVAGSLVGASGLILTQIMCKAMNRSLTNVMLGLLDTAGVDAGGDDVYAGRIKSATAEEVAMLCDAARRVVIVPGYGMAVAQAQYAVRDLANLLTARGAEVVFAIHPVAGRMPGHMNVLLAEADIPYEQLQEMDAVNPTFPQTDVALILGANDVVNPLARTDPASPIAGMPILDADKARTVVVIKRSLSPGFAGIPNPLFAADNTLMYFADGKKAVQEIAAALADL